jgi:hypothetical protein
MRYLSPTDPRPPFDPVRAAVAVLVMLAAVILARR